MDLTRTDAPPHLVLVPCPLQGHLIPMLHLADLLLSSGFVLTVIQIPSPRWETVVAPPASSRGLFFEPIAGGVECDDDASNAGEDVMSFLLKLNSECRGPVRDCLDRLGSGSPRGPAVCVIHDAVLYFAVDAVGGSGIPRLVLRTSTAANFLGLLVLDQKSYLPPQETKLIEGLQDLPSMRVKDLPLFDKCSRESTEEVLVKIHEGTKTASAIIWNTLTCLEQSSLDKTGEFIPVPIFPIGPLHKLSAETAVSRTPRNHQNMEDRSCIDWLDSQLPGSVVYVSFGSLVTLSDRELTEVALGLAESGHPFLWVIRVGPANSVSVDTIRDLTGTRQVGKITSWAPQREILAHRSIGCFWTHSGWNSTLESMCEGVPMLCWPNIGDQRIVSRLVCGVWKVGLELEVDGGSGVAIAIGRMMSGSEEGRQMKRRAMALKEEIDASMKQNGSSVQFLDSLVLFIRQLARH